LDEGFFTRLWGAAPVQGIWQVGVKMRKGPIATRPFADRSPTVIKHLMTPGTLTHVDCCFFKIKALG
jgi:hypothetical protein